LRVGIWESLRQWIDSLLEHIMTLGHLDLVISTSKEAELQSLKHLEGAVSRVLRAPVPRPPTGLARPRAYLLAVNVYRTRVLATEMRAGVRDRWPRLALAIALAGVALVGVGAHVVMAARQSIPGQPLYFVKRHIERIQYSGAEGPDVRVALGLAFLGERVAEVQALVAREAPIEIDVVVAAQQYSGQVLQSAAQLPQSQMVTSLDYIALQTARYLEVLEPLEDIAAPDNSRGLTQIVATYRRLEMLARLAQRDPQAFRVAYAAGRPELFLLPQAQPLLGPPREETVSTRY